MTAPPLLRRDIGAVGSACLAFNGIVGAGIFALPGTLHAQFGAWSPWLFPLFSLLVLVVAAPIARVAAHHSESGGPAAYAAAAFGPAAGFQIGWVYYVARVTALAANANVFATYLAAWLPLPRVLAIGALVALITWVNVVGLRRAIRLLDALTLLKALPLLLIGGWALVAFADRIPAPGSAPELGGVEAAALLILYAFVGFENSLVPAGETARPTRTIPRALIATIVGTALLYLLVQLAYVAVVPIGVAPEAPLVAWGEAVAGPAGALLITAAALASVAGNISGSVTSTPRVTLALAEQGSLPAWFGQVSVRWGTPANSVLFMGAVGLLLAVTGSFVWLAVVSTLARLFVYAASILALPTLERRRWTWPLMLPGLAICLWAAFQSEARSWITLGVLLALGAVLYAVARLNGRSTSAH